MTADNETQAFYQAEATAYAARAQCAEAGDALGQFATRLPPGAWILDLGCGGGQDAAALRDMGFHVVAVDASSGLAAEARRRWDLDVRVLDFAALDYDCVFDAVWAAASLHHAARDELPIIFTRLEAALKPRGLLRATLKMGAADRRDRFGRFFCAMDEAALRTLAAGWTDVTIFSDLGFGYDREPTTWLTLQARRS